MSTRAVTTAITLPGAFCAWLDGTGLALGHDDQDPALKETRVAYDAARPVKAGRGYYRQVTATATVLRILAEYAGYCIDANRDEPEPAELAAARTVLRRAQTALAELEAGS